MNQWPKQHKIHLNEFYGNPDVNGDGQPDPAWEAANLIYITPPYPIWWSWGPECKKIRIHRKCADSLRNILEGIGKHVNAVDRNKYQLNECGGAYNFRLVRGSNKVLSTHSWGCAIDLAPDLNPLGKRYKPEAGMMPKVVVELFKAQGWEWGGLWERPDGMHFQACRV